ncbi:MAG: stage II sporulation protein M [Verrucomicrobiota bacterium]
MIIDIEKFIIEEQPYWDELETMLKKVEGRQAARLDLDEVKRFHWLYQRTSADLGKITTLSSEPTVKAALEALVARAYAEIHQTPSNAHRFHPLRWFFVTFPQTFRRHVRAFGLSCAIMFLGSLFGAFAIAIDNDSKAVLMPFAHLQGHPSERVAEEEARRHDHMQGGKASFSATLMTHNTRVSILTLALGMFWGVGTFIMLFYNGAILGAVCADYIMAGEARFLAGWLLPHGAIEIPAILIAGQAGLVLAYALMGWKSRASLGMRMRTASKDLITFVFALALMLIWAGIIESFLSQYHEPVFKYEYKIAFGLAELTLLFTFLFFSGRKIQFQRRAAS